MRKLFLLAIMVCFLGFNWGSLAAAQEKSPDKAKIPAITTGAGYKAMVEALVAAFKTSGGQIEEMYGGHIGQMVAQIAQGSGATMVISDQATLEAVSGDVKFEKFYDLGDTVLVLAWRKGLELKSAADLTKPEIKIVTSPDPKAAIYGRAASAFLKSSGLEEKLGARLLGVASVPQVLAYIISGECDAGFINRAAAEASREKLGGSLEIAEGYPPIHMVVAVVEGHGQDPEVKRFLTFLETPPALAIIKKNGVWR
ncbi:MAG: molybdate ABC transporter substrate-binding protein [Deltaproteobacteria bacterium]|jgi:molybdate transport system substrate-binding protein|nr:molybdate ABC transporter substrate-binding protein [Deltaproteobacteria bacterium]